MKITCNSNNYGDIMYIKSFKYEDGGWNLETIYFNKQNLIVGKNSVGKSKTLNALVEVAKFIRGEVSVNSTPYKCSIVFADANGKEIAYSYSCSNKDIESENMSVDGKSIIERDSSNSILDKDTINPPTNKLIIQTQRDTNKFPEFEIVINWAEHTRGFSFSDLSSTYSFTVPSMFKESMLFDDLFDKIEKDKQDDIKNTMCDLGYNISKIGSIKLQQSKLYYIIEEGVSTFLIPSIMSNGMLRVFYVLTYMAYIATVEGAKTFLVDDLGEGLDFSRSSRLSKIMFDYCEEHDIQLIVTSNDNFLLNAIDLNDWIILQRNGKEVSTYSYNTHPDMFIKFRKMGLNNFDMLSTDYLDRFILESKK